MKLTSIVSITLLAGTALFAQDPTSKSTPMKDQAFAKTAAAGGMAEVQLGQLAAKNGESEKVKAFGQKMADDHSKANDELKNVAAQKNLALPSSVTPKDQALMDKLSKMSGSAFDKAYISAMVKDHEKDVSDFKHEANSGQDSDLKAFAAKTLPTLKSHLDMAKDAANAVGTAAR
jgi:putative membrane protein